MDVAHLIVGLGNPGPRYVCTPHNAGFAAVDLLHASCKGGEWTNRGGGVVATCRWRRESFAVLKPQEFMNLSGAPVVWWLRNLGLPVDRMVVLFDDLDLPFGAVRLRPGGGAGGHHGMESILEALGTGGFPRVRIGISDPLVPKHLKVDYLLSPLPPDRWEELVAGAKKAADAVKDAVAMGWGKAMSIHNAVPKLEPEPESPEAPKPKSPTKSKSSARPEPEPDPQP
jgi:peptidyl-tRNA hydrolase, PTH1 family